MFSEQPFNPDDDYYTIEAAIRTGDLAYAREMLRDAIQTNPNAEVWYLTALVASEPGQRVSLLHKALELDPDHERACQALAQTQAETSDSTSRSLLRRIGHVLWQRPS